jgi:hypothetical protein
VEDVDLKRKLDAKQQSGRKWGEMIDTKIRKIKSKSKVQLGQMPCWIDRENHPSKYFEETSEKVFIGRPLLALHFEESK